MKCNEIIFEATRPYVEKMVDPALMTYWEYLNMVNPQDKMHPSDSYISTVKKLNDYDSPSDYPKLINTVTVNGIEFEIRQQSDDRWDKKYTKTDKDGNIVRGPNGIALYMTRPEIEAMIPQEKRYNIEFAAIRKDTGEIVGKTENEWGALLIMVAQEYQNFGFGTLLVKLKRNENPEKNSGGFTSAGLKNFRRVYREMVQEYMSSGFYSYLVKNGTITAERAKEIIKSAGKRNPKPSEKNLNTKNPEDWVILTDDGGSYAIVYDKKIYELDKDFVDRNDYWIESFIIAMVGIGGSDSFTYIDRKYGKDTIIAKLIEILINGEYPQPIYLEEDEYNSVKKIMGNSLNSKKIEKNSKIMYKCSVNKPTINISAIVNQEKSIRKKYDQYDEIKGRIHEIAESLAS